MFNDSAIEAVKQWKYKPAQQSGRAVSVYYTVRVDFRLR
jgi:TonB family protein